MPNNDLSFNLKLERAREHLKTIENEFRTWIEGKPYRIIDEPDPEPPYFPVPSNSSVVLRRFRVDHVDPVPHRFSLLLGDCLFNIRATLDHLTLALARKNMPKMTDVQIRGSEFPVFQNQAMDRKTESKKIGCIHPDAAKVIKALQPYHRGNNYQADPLWQIHELNRIDKHRELMLCVAFAITKVSEHVGFKWPMNCNIGTFSYHHVVPQVEFKLEKVFFRYAAVPRDPAREVELEPEASLDLAFDNQGPLGDQCVFKVLPRLCEFVRDDVISPLSKFL